MPFGNILVVYDDNGQMPNIETHLVAQNMVYQKVAATATGATLYIRTQTMPETDALEAYLKTLAIPFIFFHNKIATGSHLGVALTDESVISKVEKILYVKRKP